MQGWQGGVSDTQCPLKRLLLNGLPGNWLTRDRLLVGRCHYYFPIDHRVGPGDFIQVGLRSNSSIVVEAGVEVTMRLDIEGADAAGEGGEEIRLKGVQ